MYQGHTCMLMVYILVLQSPEIPLGRVSLELQLESLVVADLVLVRCHVDPYDVFLLSPLDFIGHLCCKRQISYC